MATQPPPPPLAWRNDDGSLLVLGDPVTAFRPPGEGAWLTDDGVPTILGAELMSPDSDWTLLDEYEASALEKEASSASASPPSRDSSAANPSSNS